MGRPRLPAVSPDSPKLVKITAMVPERDFLHAQYLHSLTDCKKPLVEHAFCMYYENMPGKLNVV